MFTNHVSEAKSRKATKHTAPIQTSLVVDVKTGKVLHEQNSKVSVYPASLTKLMTLYLMFEGLESGILSMSQKFLVSEKATKTAPGNLGVKAGSYITVRDAILALIVRSANDVSFVVAENMAGTEANFAKIMTARARQLGMKNTQFKNAHGLHDPLQKTTARDMAKLAIAIKRDYPKYYPYFSRTHFVFNGKTIRGHNKVTENYAGAEGLKTGYLCASGFNLVTTASRNNKSLLAVVTGGRTAASRDKNMTQLLDKHFNNKQAPIKVASNSKAKLLKRN